MSRLHYRAAWLAALLAAGASSTAGAQPHPAITPVRAHKHTVEAISRPVLDSPLPVSIALDTLTLSKLPRATITASEHGKVRTCEGVWLADLLRQEGALTQDKLQSSQLASYVLVTARDGYRVLYSLPELDPGTGNRKVIVADRCSGQPLGARTGPLRLIAPEDLRPALGAPDRFNHGRCGAVKQSMMFARHVFAWVTSLVLIVAVPLSAAAANTAPRRAPLTVFAAASLKESMDAAAVAFERRTGLPVRVSYAASSVLSRQIEHAAPADVFVSADLEWMDYLQQRRLIDPSTRSALLGDTLVLIAPATGGAKPLLLRNGTDLKPLLGRNGRIALALTDSVPAGKYAKAGFQSLSMWSSLRSRIAEAENVRAALLLVARSEAPLGVVYASDALAEPRVRVIAAFPKGSHPPIVYSVARVAASRHLQAGVFVRWLQGPEASAIFKRHGFTLL